MEEDYILLKKYLLNLEYNAPTKAEKLLTLEYEDGEANQANEIGLSIEYQKDSGLFYVDLTVRCNVTFTATTPIFTINAIYRGVVAINFSLSDDKIKECLNILVPQELYDDIYGIIYSITEYSGFSPIEMDYYSFKAKSLTPPSTDDKI